MKTTPRQRYFLAWMDRGAVIACGYDRKWNLMLRNDLVAGVTVGVLRRMKDQGLVKPNHGTMAYEITDAGRAALEASREW